MKYFFHKLYIVSKQSNQLNKMECPICYEFIGEKNCCVTECGHNFCFKCVTKALTMNNACPCCRAQLFEEEEEEEDSEYEEDSSDDEDNEDTRVANLLTVEELNENIGVIHERLLTTNVSSNDLMKVVVLCMYSYANDELQFHDLADKITNSLNTIIPDIHNKLREEHEQQMFAKEDNIDKILHTYNGLELINHFYM